MSIPFDSGSAGYNTYRIPALAVVDGVVVALAEGRVNSSADTGNIDIVCRRSTDGGQTWDAQSVVLSHGSDTAANPCVMPSSDGLILLSCRQGEFDTSTLIRTGQAPPRRVYMQRSTDNGVSWSTAVEISDQARPTWMRHYGTGPGTGIRFASGRILAPCWHTRTPSGSDTGEEQKYYGAHGIYSDDDGFTWNIGYQSSNPSGTLNENESTLTMLPDGSVYINCRTLTDDTQPGNRADALSLNEGQSLVQACRAQGTIKVSSVQGHVITLPDGRLIFSGPDDPSSRIAMSLWVSEDNGNTWGVAYRVTGRLSGYSCMALDGPDIVLLYETGDWNTYDRIECVRIPIVSL